MVLNNVISVIFQPLSVQITNNRNNNMYHTIVKFKGKQTKLSKTVLYQQL